MKSPVRVAITGAAGQISYALLFRIAAGDMLGKSNQLSCSFWKFPPRWEPLMASSKELDDCAFPLLTDISCRELIRGSFSVTCELSPTGGCEASRSRYGAQAFVV